MQLERRRRIKGSRDLAIKRLKVWALSGPGHENRVSHQGRRGCPALSEADAALTDADLDRQVLAIPAP